MTDFFVLPSKTVVRPVQAKNRAAVLACVERKDWRTEIVANEGVAGTADLNVSNLVPVGPDRAVAAASNAAARFGR